MAFETYEESVEGGQPVELYVLTLGTTVYRMHNTLEDTISWSGDTYFKTVISHGTIQSGAEDIEVRIPADHPFALNHVTVAPGQVATLTIYNYHRGDTSDVKIVHKGIVRAVAFSVQGFEAVLHLMPITELFDKQIPDNTYQSSCNRALFDARCQVSSASFKFTGSVGTVSGNTIITPGLASSKGTGWATGGYVSYGILDFRLILDHTSDTLTLVLPFFESVLSQTVEVFSGCDHTIAICASKFSNEINFGGWPEVPTKNIFITGL